MKFRVDSKSELDMGRLCVKMIVLIDFSFDIKSKHRSNIQDDFRPGRLLGLAEKRVACRGMRSGRVRASEAMRI